MQILEAQESGIIKSYFLTTRKAMNARRETDLCMWCDAIWSDQHRCASPDYNCRFSFGEDYDGMAFVQVTKEGLKIMEVQHSDEDDVVDEFGEPDSILSGNAKVSTATENSRTSATGDAYKLFDEITEPNIGYLKEKHDDFNGAQKVYEEMPTPVLCLKGSDPSKMTVSESGILCQEEVESQVEANADQISDLVSCSNEIINELLLPTYSNEMAEANINTELNSILCDYASLVRKVQSDHFARKLQLCSHVSLNSSITLNTNHSTKFIKNAIFPLFPYGLACYFTNSEIREDWALMIKIKMAEWVDEVIPQIKCLGPSKLVDKCSLSALAHSYYCTYIEHPYNRTYIDLFWMTERCVVFDPGIRMTQSIHPTLKDKGVFRGREKYIASMSFILGLGGVLNRHSYSWGLVVFDKNSFEIISSDIMLSLALYAIDIPEELVFLHPVHSYALFAYDSSVIRVVGAATVRATELLPGLIRLVMFNLLLNCLMSMEDAKCMI